ncbi:17777_t:CDS:1, partial [Racocetra fulgida]
NSDNVFSLQPQNSEEDPQIIGQIIYHRTEPIDVALINLTGSVKPLQNIKNLDSNQYPELFIT